MTSTERTTPPRILVVGGGYVGLYTALRLDRKMQRGEAAVTVVDPRSYMTYQPFLPEAGAGSIQPRHTVVPLRQTLRAAEVITGWVTDVEHGRKVATVQPLEGAPYELGYDVLVMAVGSVPRTLPIPGLAEWASGFKNVEEAIQLRNRVLECLDIAESATDPVIRERNLTFVFVGGGFAGVEALAEIEDLARYATRYLRNVAPSDLRFVLVEASGRILPEVGEDMGRWTVEQLRERGIEVRLETRLQSTVEGNVILSDGTTMLSDTVVWTAGVRPHPLLAATDLPLDERGRLMCHADLSVQGVPDAWGAGDCTAVPDLTQPGVFCAPSAQHAVRQAKVLADNVLASMRGFATEGLPARVQRLGRLARPLQGRRAGEGGEAARLPGLVPAPDLSHDQGADDATQGAGRHRLDHRVPVQAGRDEPVEHARAVPRVLHRREGRVPCRSRLTSAASHATLGPPRHAPVAQLAEARCLNQRQCGFDPCRGHQRVRRDQYELAPTAEPMELVGREGAPPALPAGIGCWLSRARRSIRTCTGEESSTLSARVSGYRGFVT